MQQYDELKAVHPGAILLFRVGDFFETFSGDAIKTAAILGITLTRRANGAASSVELAGFPHHALQTYLPKLVRAGERVAICEQTEDAKMAKGLVKRAIVELITPGVTLSENVLQPKTNTFLAALHFGKHATGAAFLDLSTGEFYAAQGSDSYIDKLLGSMQPREIVFSREQRAKFEARLSSDAHTFELDQWVFSEKINREKLCKQFHAASLKGFGIDELGEAIAAAGAILYYLEFTEHRHIDHIASISRLDEGEHLWIDRFTMRNLELFASSDGQSGGFFEAIDRTTTPMGARLLRRWIAMPLIDQQRIALRQHVVQELLDRPEVREELQRRFALIGDLERIASRIATRRITPREVAHLRSALETIAKLKNIPLAAQLDPCTEMAERIAREVYPDPATNQIAKGGVIADGVDAELDDLRNIASRGRLLIDQIQQRESERTGIPSLKVSFNNVFGYYIEVRNTHKEKVPPEWIRKQTLTAAERYITAELKEYEQKILGAQERMLVIEARLWEDLMVFLSEGLAALQRNAAIIARLDCLLSFALMAAQRGYCRPVLDQSNVLQIEQGRHPVIETLLPVGEPYIPNDLRMDDSAQQIILITGPNMAGKSALLRQTALIVLMAQMGSFVPAKSAHIGMVDKLFTRVGASDNISRGESTFMVEMLESAGILNNISPRSLVILDEIGRGTSTYDGISIAWAMVEYLHDHPSGARAKTLFATHYHELNVLEGRLERVKNFHVAVREDGRNIIFLRTLLAGGISHSLGIHVARMAGMPARIVERAEEVLHGLETAREEPPAVQNSAAPNLQLTMFQLDDPVLTQVRDRIRDLRIDTLTPLEALNTLNQLKTIIGL